jgi:hypothetical protein
MARLLKEWDFLDSAADMETNNGATQVLARMLDLPPPGEPWTV